MDELNKSFIETLTDEQIELLLKILENTDNIKEFHLDIIIKYDKIQNKLYE
jgi:hypothetical protein